jgi:hypothetical protein
MAGIHLPQDENGSDGGASSLSMPLCQMDHHGLLRNQLEMMTWMCMGVATMKCTPPGANDLTKTLVWWLESCTWMGASPTVALEPCPALNPRRCMSSNLVSPLWPSSSPQAAPPLATDEETDVNANEDEPWTARGWNSAESRATKPCFYGCFCSFRSVNTSPAAVEFKTEKLRCCGMHQP